MKEITLGNSGKSAIIDDGDFDWLDKWKWRFDQNTGYAFRREYSYGKRLWISMHRVILSPAVGMMADHMNRDKLDNRRSNLRAVDSSGNNHNKGITTRNKSGIPGVCWREKTKRWRSSVGYQNRAVALGEFKNKDDAANAFIAAKLRISKGLAPTESLALDAAGRLGWTETDDSSTGCFAEPSPPAPVAEVTEADEELLEKLRDCDCDGFCIRDTQAIELIRAHRLTENKKLREVGDSMLKDYQKVVLELEQTRAQLAALADGGKVAVGREKLLELLESERDWIAHNIRAFDDSGMITPEGWPISRERNKQELAALRDGQKEGR